MSPGSSTVLCVCWPGVACHLWLGTQVPAGTRGGLGQGCSLHASGLSAPVGAACPRGLPGVLCATAVGHPPTAGPGGPWGQAPARSWFASPCGVTEGDSTSFLGYWAVFMTESVFGLGKACVDGEREGEGTHNPPAPGVRGRRPGPWTGPSVHSWAYNPLFPRAAAGMGHPQPFGGDSATESQSSSWPPATSTAEAQGRQAPHRCPP